MVRLGLGSVSVAQIDKSSTACIPIPIIGLSGKFVLPSELSVPLTLTLINETLQIPSP